MLVGEHGRVIPFRHFKALISGVGVVLILSLAAVILLGFLYTRQGRQLSALQKDLEKTRTQTAKIRDEKDLYLTQLIALQKQTGELPKKQSADPEPEEKGGPRSPEIKKQQEPKKVEKPVAEPKPEPKVKWSADIRNFKAAYDNRQQILKAQFRLYNISRPKKTLSGRSVVVFKATDDAPIHWVPVPAVPLRDGKPAGNIGKSFRIRNYRTETFKTLRNKNSAEYDTASVYIFTNQGELITQKDLPFNIDYSPPEPPKPAKPQVAPAQEKPLASEPVSQQNQQAPSDERPAARTVPGKGAPGAVPIGTVTSPTAPPEGPVPASPQEVREKEPQGAPENQGDLEPAKTDSTTETPAAEPKPASEGGLK